MVQGTKEMKHDTNHEKNICHGIYWKDVSVSDWKFSQELNDLECAAVVETEDFMKKEIILDCFALSVGMGGSVYVGVGVCVGFVTCVCVVC